MLPTQLTGTSAEKVACLDGDGDRLIYFKRTDKPLIINGSKVFASIMTYIVELIETLGLKDSISTCLVTTAYTNSQCFRFLNGLEI